MLGYNFTPVEYMVEDRLARVIAMLRERVGVYKPQEPVFPETKRLKKPKKKPNALCAEPGCHKHTQLPPYCPAHREYLCYFCSRPFRGDVERVPLRDNSYSGRMKYMGKGKEAISCTECARLIQLHPEVFLRSDRSNVLRYQRRENRIKFMSDVRAGLLAGETGGIPCCVV